MEIVAAERLNKIGKSPSIVSTRADFEDDMHTVNELLMQSSAVNSSGSDESLAGYNSGGGGGGKGGDGAVGEDAEEGTDTPSSRKKQGSSKRSIGRLLSMTKARINGGSAADISGRREQQQLSPDQQPQQLQQLAAPLQPPLPLKSPVMSRQRPASFTHQSSNITNL